jgi:hypothetical protein
MFSVPTIERDNGYWKVVTDIPAALSAEGRELVTHLLLTEVRSALAAFAIWLTCQLSERPSTTSLLTQWIMAKWFQDAQL